MRGAAFLFSFFQKRKNEQIIIAQERRNGTMIVEFSKNLSVQEQQSIMNWLENNKLQSCQIVKINGVDYNFIVVFENNQIVAIRVIK